MINGIVIKSTGKHYLVKIDNDSSIVPCVLRGKFKQYDYKSTNPIAVGEYVEIELSGGEGVIVKILPRKNKIVRRSTNLSRYAHVLAVNIDYAVVVFTLKMPKTYLEFLDRFLAAAEQNFIEPIVVINKIDLLTTEETLEMETIRNMYETIGYKTFQISVNQCIGISEFGEFIKNRTVLLSGNSGVGKSSLINTLNSKLSIKTGRISSAHTQGRHTTTFAEMHPFGEGYLIDTPGIKGFGLTDFTNSDVSDFFKEFRLYSPYCKFNNCTHTHEPGCKIKSAVESGQISKTRYSGYLSIITDNETDKYRKDDYI